MEPRSNPYIDPRLEIRWIPEIAGRGVFAKEHIVEGTILEKAALVIYPAKIMDMAIYLLQAEGMRSHEFKLDQYVVEWDGDQCAVPLGWAAIYNHSDNNNCRFASFDKEDLLAIIAIRDIAAGEQCCVTYGPTWFDKKGYIKKVDF